MLYSKYYKFDNVLIFIHYFMKDMGKAEMSDENR